MRRCRASKWQRGCDASCGTWVSDGRRLIERATYLQQQQVFFFSHLKCYQKPVLSVGEKVTIQRNRLSS